MAVNPGSQIYKFAMLFADMAAQTTELKSRLFINLVCFFSLPVPVRLYTRYFFRKEPL